MLLFIFNKSEKCKTALAKYLQINYKVTELLSKNVWRDKCEKCSVQIIFCHVVLLLINPTSHPEKAI